MCYLGILAAFGDGFAAFGDGFAAFGDGYMLLALALVGLSGIPL